MPTELFRTSVRLPSADTRTPPPAELLSELCASDRPLALLPVRLETRFFLKPDSTYELRVRIYPDKIHIDAHERELTSTEREWGRHYWEQDWRAGNDESAQRTAWRQLAERFNAARAAWIARALRPTNPYERPTALTPPNQPLPAAPAFPALPDLPADDADVSWRHPPLAQLLPEKWTAIAYAAGRIVATATGNTIRKPLAIGPNPKAQLDSIPNDTLAIDEGMRWMVDFEEAEAAGMGLRLPLGQQVATAGIETLVVLGVSAMTGDDGAKQFSDLIDAHHYTDGLSFLRTAVPTNNTDEERSGYNGRDAGAQSSFNAEMNPVDPAADADSNASQLASILGLAPESVSQILGRLPYAGELHNRHVRSMNTALWSTTWGYFLTNMVGLDGTGLTPESLAWARNHFISYVHGIGTFAAIRCARQPYGVLPVTSLDLWAPSANAATDPRPEAWLRTLLINLRDKIWRSRLSDVARVGRTGSPATDLAEVMRVDAHSNSYVTRAVMGGHYLQHLRAFMLEDVEGRGWFSAEDQISLPPLQKLGLTAKPRLARATYEDRTWNVVIPVVQAGEISSKRGLEPNYIQALLAEPTIQGIRDGHVQIGQSGSLLHALLRHAALREYANAAARILSSQGSTFNGQDTRLGTLIKDEELINLMPGSAPSMTWARQLDQVVPTVTGTQTLRSYLEGLTQFQTPAVDELGSFRTALMHLQSVDSEYLQSLTQSVLDVASHRLDAWITSLATKRLFSMRETQAQGVYVGGYGWVENLSPAPVPPAIAAPEGESGLIYTQPDDPGFIHAPSFDHASTAALLRNAHLGHNGAALPDGPFAIDLSSRRAREAEQLLDGVRQGQPLGALLGYRFERRLHEMAMDRFIDKFRAIAPLTADRLADPAEPQENIRPNNVVDGLALHEKWPEKVAELQSLTGTAFSALEKELKALGETIDAVSDALTAETAYQVVRGNTTRTASTLQSVSRGDAPPPELEVTRTPRSGIALTHRVAVLFNETSSAQTGWSSSDSLRSEAEPILEAWVAGLLGDPRKVRCVIDRVDEHDAIVGAPQDFRLSELEISALDAAFSVEAEPRPAGLTDLEQHLLYYVQRKPGGFPPGSRLKIRSGRPPDLAASDLTLHDIIEQARNVRRLLARSRALDGNDLDLPERATVGGVDFLKLAARVTAAEVALATVHGALQSAIEGTNAEDLRVAMLHVGRLGVRGFVPLSVAGNDDTQLQILATQARALAKETQARMDEGERLRGLAAADGELKRRDQLLDRLKTVFGGGFVALPAFSCANAADLIASRAAAAQLQGGDSLAAYSWFARAERVREPLFNLGVTLRAAEVLRTGDRLELSIVQLPFVGGERWVGLPLEYDQTLPAGRLSLIVQAAAALDPASTMFGMLIDEWVEVVPNRNERTAITFQFNPPDACAPQSILVAVPPVPDKPWTAWDLQRVLLETLDLAKLRGVEPELLGELSQYLPALYFGLNADNAAVSTDFAPLTHSRPD